jgi:hypothetical protein
MLLWPLSLDDEGCVQMPGCRQLHKHKQAAERERQLEMELLSADPFDMEAQAKIAERIRQQQVEENYQTAYEHTPEVFSQVTMLYVDMEVSNARLLPIAGAHVAAWCTACASRPRQRCILCCLKATPYFAAHGCGGLFSQLELRSPCIARIQWQRESLGFNGT